MVVKFYNQLKKKDVTQEDGVTNYNLTGQDKSIAAGEIRSATADAKRLEL